MATAYTAAVFQKSSDYSAAAIPAAFRLGENMPMGYLANLKAVRQARGLTQTQLADLVGLEQPTIQRYEAGRSPSLSQAIEIADALGVSLTELVDPNAVIDLGPRLFIKGEVAAGIWKEAIEYPREEWVAFTGRAGVQAQVQHRFGLRVCGESMNEVYPHGTILECVSVFGHVEIEPGKRVIVVRRREDGDFEATVKEYHVDDLGRHWLRPRSNHPDFQQWFRLDEEEPGIVERVITAIVVSATMLE